MARLARVEVFASDGGYHELQVSGYETSEPIGGRSCFS